MTTRTEIRTLLRITLGLAALTGCDVEPTDDQDLRDESNDAEEVDEVDDDADAPLAGPDELAANPGGAPMSTPVNLALGRPTQQSSTLFGAGSARAVDGNRDGSYPSGSVTHTDEGQSWWQVDLESVQPVGEVVLWNRTDCCAERLHDFDVHVSADGVHWEAFSYDGVAGERASVLIDRPLRWLRIINPTVLSLAEVEVLRTRNLAYGKPVQQSSTAVGGMAARAVDGNTDGDFTHGSVTHTDSEQSPWIQVDLESVQAIGQVVIWNRTDCCAERLHDFTVRVSNDGASWYAIPFAGSAGPQVVVTVNREARYVRIDNGPNPLHIAELQVFEAPRLTELSYGRGVGMVPASYGCEPGAEYDAGLCYTPCAPDYDGVGPVCWHTGPASYGRGVGWVPGAYGCGPGAEYDAGLCYPLCAPSYDGVGPVCWLEQASYGRGVGTPVVPGCSPGLESDAGLCYTPCSAGYHGVGPVCWLDDIDIESIASDGCELLRVPFMAQLARELGAALTTGVGLSAAAAMLTSVEIGVAYGAEGEFGCYVAGCTGTTTDVGVSAYATAGLYTDFSDIAGSSTVVSGGASVGIPETPIAIGGAAAVVSNQEGPIGLTISASVGLGPEPISIAVSGMSCETEVLVTQP
jgi:F5/8 type C domain